MNILKFMITAMTLTLGGITLVMTLTPNEVKDPISPIVFSELDETDTFKLHSKKGRPIIASGVLRSFSKCLKSYSKFHRWRDVEYSFYLVVNEKEPFLISVNDENKAIHIIYKGNSYRDKAGFLWDSEIYNIECSLSLLEVNHEIDWKNFKDI